MLQAKPSITAQKSKSNQLDQLKLEYWSLPLQSELWKDNNRLQQAATVAFQSMKLGRDAGTEAINLLQTALVLLEGRPADDSGTLFGPYAWGGEYTGEGAYFGRHTERAVMDFQKKAECSIDGKAGIETLHTMDAYLVANFSSEE